MEHPSDLLKELDQLKGRIHALMGTLRQDLVRESLSAKTIPVLTCEVAEKRYGIILDAVEEVLMACSVTMIPEAPGWVSGLLNLHGAMVPVLDVAARISGTEHAAALSDMVIIISREGKRFGLQVQEVFNVVELQTGSIQENTSNIPQAPYLLGTFEQGDKPIFLLSISCLLHTSRLPEGL